MCFKYFFGISTKKEKKKKKKNSQCVLNRRRKRVVLKNCCEVFRDKNHQNLYKNIKLYNDIESNPGPVYVNELCTVTGSFHQGNEELFGINAGKQCVVNSLVAIIFNATASYFAETWNSTKMDNILRVGNSLYSYIRLLSYFFVKIIPLSRRVEYVMDGSTDQWVSESVSHWVSERCMYVTPIRSDLL